MCIWVSRASRVLLLRPRAPIHRESKQSATVAKVTITLPSNSCTSRASFGICTVTNIKAAAIRLTLACALATPVRADTITVTNTNDSGPGSLRQALVDANDGDTIDATGVFGVITLTTGELIVDKSVTINGAGADLLAVDGNTTSRVFHIDVPSQTVTISGLTMRNAHSNFGGGIFNSGLGMLTITNSTLRGNTAAFGAGIFNGAMLVIVNSTISDNMTGADGAGIYNVNGNTVMITNSTFSGNIASGTGSVCVNNGPLQIANSTLSGNSARFFGGIFNEGTLQIGDTILNAGASGANIYNSGGTVSSLGYNLSSDDGGGYLNGPGDQINTDPLLGPLQNNGGSTFTHALLPGSPAIDAGDPNFTPPPFFDQRGPNFWRVRNNRIDVGSFEVQAGATPTPTATATASPTPTPTAMVTPTASVPPSPTPTATATPTATSTSTATPTATPPTATPTATPTPRSEPTPRSRPSPPPRPTR